MQRFDRLADTLLKPINPAVIVVLGMYTVLWGCWIVSPFWSVFPHAALFHIMASLASEYVWGGIAIASGLIIVRGAIKPIYWNIEIGALVAFFFWLTIGILYFIGDWQNTGGITASCFALYSALIWVNIRVNRTHFGWTEE